jgi:sugar lactone lactonase YvrE
MLDDVLWFSDVVRQQVLRLAPEGSGIEVVADVPGRPSGLGFPADRTPWVAVMRTRRVVALEAGGPAPVADLTDLCPRVLGDMTVDPVRELAYVSSLGVRDDEGGIVLVSRDGAPRRVADVGYPNGSALLGDDRLVVADTFTGRLLSWQIADDGSLVDETVFAELPGRHPDGLTVDAEGAVWVGCYDTSEFVRVEPGGRTTHRIPVHGWALDCALAEPGGDVLYLAVADTDRDRFNEGDSQGAILVADIGPAGHMIPGATHG